jgi:hypothetical protein
VTMDPVISTLAVPTTKGLQVFWQVCVGDVCLAGPILALLLAQAASWSHQPVPGPSTIQRLPQLASE